MQEAEAGLQATLSHVTTTTMAHRSGNPRAEEVVQEAKPQVIILEWNFNRRQALTRKTRPSP